MSSDHATNHSNDRSTNEVATENRIKVEENEKMYNCMTKTKDAAFDYNYEIIDKITVIRDDYLCGGTKSRFLHLIPSGYSEYVYATNPYGGAGLALATKFGSKITVFVDEKFLGPLARTAVKLGAKYFYVPPNQSNVHEYAKRYAEKDKSRFLVPNGLDLPGVNEYIKNMGDEIGKKLGKFDVAFIPCGSGTLVRGLSASNLLAQEYIAINVTEDCPPVGNATCIKHHLPVNVPAPLESMPKYSSTMYYDAKVWQYAKDYADNNRNKRVLVWNVL